MKLIMEKIDKKWINRKDVLVPDLNDSELEYLANQNPRRFKEIGTATLRHYGLEEINY